MVSSSSVSIMSPRSEIIDADADIEADEETDVELEAGRALVSRAFASVVAAKIGRAFALSISSVAAASGPSES